LAAVLREAVTNVLGHSSGSQCRIAIAELERRFTLSVSNDGTASPAQVASGDRAGLNNLAVRMSVIGGRLDVTSGEDWFVLTARTPPVPAQRLHQVAARR
jgi:two-component system sensor histidine kinase DesK